MDAQMNGWMDEWIDGWIDNYCTNLMIPPKLVVMRMVIKYNTKYRPSLDQNRQDYNSKLQISN